MNPNICNNCGGDFEYRNGRWICRSCGSYKPEELSNEEATLLYTAFQKLRLAEFDEAEQDFDDILQKYPQNPNGYWGRLMSRYGIKYEVDFDGKMIPTCYATSIESVISDPDYKKAIRYADAENQAYYQRQAEYIERVRREWVETAKKEKPYDIFICYKDSDPENGIERTRDSIAAQDLYIHLTNKGYRVFYSHESLRGKVGEKFEPYIFNALSTAKVMLVYGSKPEYITSTWLKNEWTRYEKRMRAGEKNPHSLLVACDGFSPNHLPRVLSSMQCFNANERSFYSDLDEAIERILYEKQEPAFTPTPPPTATPTAQKPKKKTPLIALPILLVAVLGILIWALPGRSQKCDHVPLLFETVKPSCTETGWVGGQYCAICDEVLAERISVEAEGHKPAGDPTCTSPSVCLYCSEVLEPARGHVPGPEATCTEAQNCLECGLELNPAEGHKPGAEPTCTEAQYCTVCNEELEPAREHDYNPDVTEPTCTKGGYTTFICHCGDSYIGDETEALGHEPASNATCTEASYCTRCETLLNPENGHIPGAPATCTEAQYCSVCLTELAPANGHSYTPTVKPPTCTEGGYTTYICHCGDTYDDNYTEANGHSPSGKTVCTEASVCTVCHEELEPATEHEVTEWTVDRELTENVTGIRHGTCAVCGETVRIEYQYSQDLSYEENEDGGYTVYRGSCADDLIILPSVHNGKPVTAIGTSAFYGHSTIKTVIIPDTVTVIGDSAFVYCSALERVTFSANLTEIRENAFAGCTNLQSISLPDGLITIGDGAFNECEALRSLTIPDSVTTLGTTAFAHCTNLTAITIGNGISEIGWATFSHCTSLTDLTIGSKVTVIGESAFLSCESLTEASIPPSVQTIGPSAFSSCERLRTLVLHEGLTLIESNAFSYCKGLQILVIPDSVSNIKDCAFFSCSGLISVTVGRNVTAIENQAFDHCSKLIEVINRSSLSIAAGEYSHGLIAYYAKYVHTGESKLINENGYLFCYFDSAYRLVGYAGEDTELVLPDTCQGENYQHISHYAFFEKNDITSVYIPASITSIADLSFGDCVSLASITFGGTVDQWNSVSLGISWNNNVPAEKVICSDGEVSLY